MIDNLHHCCPSQQEWNNLWSSWWPTWSWRRWFRMLARRLFDTSSSGRSLPLPPSLLCHYTEAVFFRASLLVAIEASLLGNTVLKHCGLSLQQSPTFQDDRLGFPRYFSHLWKILLGFTKATPTSFFIDVRVWRYSAKVFENTKLHLVYCFDLWLSVGTDVLSPASCVRLLVPAGAEMVVVVVEVEAFGCVNTPSLAPCRVVH